MGKVRPEVAKAWHVKNRAKSRAACRRWADKNREYNRERSRKWKAANREKVRDYNRQWKQDNPAYASDWRSQNIERCKFYLASYRGRKAHATPAWADADAIAAIYAEAERLTRETGVLHEVDHVIPLCGKNVCGLHVQDNLEAISQSANRAKGNRFDG